MGAVDKIKMDKLWSKMENIVRYMIKDVFRIPVKDESLNNVFQFLKFGLVGVSNTIISYFTYLILVLLGMHYMPANGIAFAVSVLNSFYWNNKYVFAEEKEKRKWYLVLAKTFIAYGFTGLFLNSVLLYLEVDLWQINELLAPLINLIITIPLNFIINKFWAYKKK